MERKIPTRAYCSLQDKNISCNKQSKLIHILYKVVTKIYHNIPTELYTNECSKTKFILSSTRHYKFTGNVIFAKKKKSRIFS